MYMKEFIGIKLSPSNVRQKNSKFIISLFFFALWFKVSSSVTWAFYCDIFDETRAGLVNTSVSTMDFLQMLKVHLQIL